MIGIKPNFELLFKGWHHDEDFQRSVVLALGGEGDAKPKARLVTALINGLTLDNLRVPESEADRILADLREGLRLLFAG